MGHAVGIDALAYVWVCGMQCLFVMCSRAVACGLRARPFSRTLLFDVLWKNCARAADSTKHRVQHSVALYGQRLLFCDQSMREKARRRRARGA